MVSGCGYIELVAPFSPPQLTMGSAAQVTARFFYSDANCASASPVTRQMRQSGMTVAPMPL
jgi:hypothetical protein